jgi:superfamily II DNA or RNA helicase
MFADYMNNHNNCIIVGSYDTTGTGVSIKNLRWGLSSEAFKSFFLVEQVIGRFMRLFTGKDNFVFYDVIDDGRIIVEENGVKKTKKNYFYDWMTAKENNYKENGFKVTKQFIEQQDKKDKPKGLLD